MAKHDLGAEDSGDKLGPELRENVGGLEKIDVCA